MTVILIVIGALGIVTKILIETGGFGNKRTTGDHPRTTLFRLARIPGKVFET